MTPEHQRLQQAAQLQRLREWRRTQAEADARRARQAQAQALAAVQAAQALLGQQRQARQALLEGLAQGELLPRWAAQAQARRELNDEHVERAEYALIDEEEGLHDRDRELDQAGAALRAAWARAHAAELALQQARRQLGTARERRTEREDPLFLTPPHGALR
jgi:hypothetical protein